METSETKDGSAVDSGVFDIALADMAGEPRGRDLDIAERLGFGRTRDIRKLIERCQDELETYGPLARHRGASISGKGRVVETEEFWLNEEQALLVSVMSDAVNAPKVRAMLIRVFTAWRKGHLEALASPVDVQTNGIARQMNGKVTRLEHMVADLTRTVQDLIIMADPRRAVLDYVSVRQMLDDDKALPKGRNSLNRKFGHALKMRALMADGPNPARKCPHSGVWLYQRDFAATFMKERGHSLVVDHNAGAVGQGVIVFPDRRKSNADRPTPVQP